jgi:hypothetical protein
MKINFIAASASSYISAVFSLRLTFFIGEIVEKFIERQIIWHMNYLNDRYPR